MSNNNIKENFDKSFHFHQKAAEGGDVKAMFNLAYCYHKGEGTDRDIEKAFHWCQKAAEGGNVKAMNNLANYYLKGEGTERNLEKAFYWYQKAAEGGHVKAMFSLAFCYHKGEGTNRDSEKAFHWYQKVAEGGDVRAMNNLAFFYHKGEGTERDSEKAFHWYQKAVDGGDVLAMNNLANCYHKGEGTERNLEKAFYWYQKAAEGGDVEAMSNLAFCYYKGEGMERDSEKAFYWYQKAAEGGNIMAMNNLANCYHKGEGMERDSEKALYWFQKAAESGDMETMNNLAFCYNKGEGIERDSEKAFYWYQKAAESGVAWMMSNLADCYYKGEGTERDLEKAFHWCQKAAEGGDVGAMNNLANCYSKGEGTKRDLEKAFYWYQKVAEGGDVEGMYNLAFCYHKGKGIKRDLEKAFHWYQKAAEGGEVDAMLNLANCYEGGKGTGKDLEKAFYWYQKVAESGNKISFKNKLKLCKKCNQQYTDYKWCQQCNSKRFQQDFSKWTSKNEFIDRFIQEAQLNAKSSYEVLEWIPYNKLSSINYHDKGGFSKIYKAIWSDGPIDSWNFDKQQWNRWNFQAGYEVVLKTLNNSSNLNSNFLDEWKHHYNCQKKSFSKLIQFFGITQDPDNLNYIIVMSYAKKGNLRKCLSDLIKFKWQDKLQLLKKIILGLKVIHESNLTHGDFHDGNILMSDNHNELFIIDLGLCKPINELQDSDKNDDDIYGVLPYMAPEILRHNPYTSASDIYSFSMIMWEFTSGTPPFNDGAHDLQLSLNICKGERPEIIKNTPKCYVDLMKKCWDSNPSNRPTIAELEYKISEWIRCINDYYEYNRNGEFKHESPNIDNNLKSEMFEFIEANNAFAQKQTNISTIVQLQLHSQAYYTSRNLTEIFFKGDSEYLEYMI